MITALTIEKSDFTQIVSSCDSSIKDILGSSTFYKTRNAKLDYAMWTVLDPINNAIFTKQQDMFRGVNE